MNSKTGNRLFTGVLYLGILGLSLRSVNAQEIENTFQARTSIDLSKKITKNLKITLTPELRWKDKFELDRYQLTTEVEYQPINFLSLSAGYRLIGNKRKEDNTEFLNRYQFSANFETRIKRWEPGFRLRFTNYTDDSEGEMFLRYKTFLSYDIPKCKLTPEAAFEIYHQPDLHSIYKYRCSLGANYKMSKRITVGLDYKLDLYMTAWKNRHLLDMGLKIKF